MLFIIGMISGAFIEYFGLKLSYTAIKNAESKNPTFALVVGIIIVFFGVWMFTNAIECYQYIIEHNAMELFF